MSEDCIEKCKKRCNRVRVNKDKKHDSKQEWDFSSEDFDYNKYTTVEYDKCNKKCKNENDVINDKCASDCRSKYMGAFLKRDTEQGLVLPSRQFETPQDEYYDEQFQKKVREEDDDKHHIRGSNVTVGRSGGKRRSKRKSKRKSSKKGRKSRRKRRTRK
jgi:hypothetical protein